MKTSDFGKVICLCYHRVLTNTDISLYPIDGLSVTETEIRQEFKYLKKKFRLVNLKNRCKNYSYNDVLITFDDGYKGIIEYVLPIIEELNIPITIFITSGFIESDTEFCWWEDLWKNILANESICLEVNSNNVFYELKSLKQKMQCYNSISQLLNKKNRQEQIAYFQNNNLKFDFSNGFLNLEDIIKLSSNPLITIGFHSALHLNYLLESDITIKEDIERISFFFDYYLKINYEKYMAYCYGAESNSQTNMLLKKFSHIFGLGIKYLFKRNIRHSSSRLLITNGLNIKMFTLKIKVYMLILRLSIFLHR